jgi:hypothetical protein
MVFTLNTNVLSVLIRGSERRTRSEAKSATMKRERRRPSARGLGSGARRGVSLYLLGFLLAVAVAPHRHINSLEDLLSDGPSDSGIFIEARPVDPTAATQVQSARLVDDDPCLACFHHDYDASAQQLFVLSRTFTPRQEIDALPVVTLADPCLPPFTPPPRVL